MLDRFGPTTGTCRCGRVELEIARKQGERVQVWRRRGADFTFRFPAIAEAGRGLSANKPRLPRQALLRSLIGLASSTLLTRQDRDALRCCYGAARGYFDGL